MLAMRQDAGCDITALRVDGGASANNFLMQFQADVLRCPIDRPVMVETTALGAAFLAGLASGVWESVDDIALLRQSDRIFKPEMDAEQAKQQHDNKRRDRRLCDADAAEQRDGKVDFRTIHGVESPSFVFCAAWESGRKKSMSLMQNCAKSSGRMAASGSHSSARNSRI